jgi:acetyl-CoA carboxylase biotin carboxyl carrier protein
MRLRYEDIGEILKIIDSSSCDEFLLETDEIKLVVRRHGANSSSPPVFAEAMASPGPASVLSARPATAAPQAPAAAIEQGHHVVRAPMVGTFYRALSPDAPPFVEVGSTVHRGDPLCIIEVMKLFTTIFADCDGRVAEIGAANASLVEYGQILFVIEPSLNVAQHGKEEQAA